MGDITTTTTYQRPAGYVGDFPTRIQVTYDNTDDGLTYVGHWDSNGDISEFNLTREDLRAMTAMLVQARNAPHIND